MFLPSTSLCSHPYYQNHPSDMAIEGTLTLHVLLKCPEEVNVTFDPGSLIKQLYSWTWNLAFPKAKFKEIFSDIRKKKSTKEDGCKKIKHQPGRTSCLSTPIVLVAYPLHVLTVSFLHQLPGSVNNALSVNSIYCLKI